MSLPAAPEFVELQKLRLDMARSLLEQTKPGEDLDEHPADPTAYLQQLIDGLCDLSLRDPLTGLSNRREFRTALERELDRVARSGEGALLLMLDIDHFKAINDQHGHPVGDMVLQSLAHTLAECVRPMDVLARYGGEEFAVVLPACQPGFGHTVAERIRQAIETTPIRVAPSQQIHITVSIGGAFAQPWVRSTTTLWIDRADQQLYHAKAAGRNCVRIEAQADSTVTAEEKSFLFDQFSLPAPGPDDAGLQAKYSAPEKAIR